MGTQIILVNLYRTDIATQFCLTSNPVSFQLLEAVNCEKEKTKPKQKNDPGNYCSRRVLVIVSTQLKRQEARN